MHLPPTAAGARPTPRCHISPPAACQPQGPSYLLCLRLQGLARGLLLKHRQHDADMQQAGQSPQRFQVAGKARQEHHHCTHDSSRSSGEALPGLPPAGMVMGQGPAPHRYTAQHDTDCWPMGCLCWRGGGVVCAGCCAVLRVGAVGENRGECWVSQHSAIGGHVCTACCSECTEWLETTSKNAGVYVLEGAVSEHRAESRRGG